jgi:hypothetical protein
MPALRILLVARICASTAAIAVMLTDARAAWRWCQDVRRLGASTPSGSGPIATPSVATRTML